MAVVFVVFVVDGETVLVLLVVAFLAVVVLPVVTCFVPIVFVESFFWAFAMPARSKNVARGKMNFFIIIFFSLKNDSANLRHSLFLTSILPLLNQRLTCINRTPVI